jgi:hypothetical protein
MGHTTRSFTELPTNISRPTVFGKDVLYGRTTYAPGNDWVFTLARCLVFTRYSPEPSIQMWR